MSRVPACYGSDFGHKMRPIGGGLVRCSFCTLTEPVGDTRARRRPVRRKYPEPRPPMDWTLVRFALLNAAAAVTVYGITRGWW